MNFDDFDVGPHGGGLIVLAMLGACLLLVGGLAVVLL